MKRQRAHTVHMGCFLGGGHTAVQAPAGEVFCAHTYLWQLGHNEAELMITDKLPESQSLIGAMHQLLDALQGRFLVDLSLGCTNNG